MHEAAQLEFPGSEYVATKRGKSKVSKLWEHFQAVKAAAAEHGMLLPQAYAADLLDVSRQRVHVLVNEGRLQVVEVEGHRYVTENSMREYADSERTAGRPVKVPGVGKMFRHALCAGDEIVAKIK